MNTQQIEYVIMLAEEKSFVKAAARLYVTQPALSQFIKNVENEVGAKLFERGKGALRLTEVGELYIESARRIREEERDFSRKVGDLTNLTKGRFTIGTSSFRASCLLPKSIETFQQRYPGIQLNIIVDHVSKLKTCLSAGEIDLIIESSDFDTAKFASEPLFGERYYLAAPKNHEFNRLHENKILNIEDITEDREHLYEVPGINLEELAELPFVWMDRGINLYRQFEEMCERKKVKPNIRMRANQIETAFHWGCAGLAFSFIPDTLIRFGNHKEHPNYYKISSPFSAQEIQFAMRKSQYITKAMKEYIQILKELIGCGTWNPVNR